MISEELKQKIWELRQQGKSLQHIGIELKVSLATVSLWCDRFDPNRKYNLTKKVKDEEINDIIKYYLESNKSLNKVTKHFKCFTRQTLRSILISKKVYEFPYKKKTKDQIKKDKSLAVINWKKNKKIKLIQYKGGKCEICGYNKCEHALEFHHIDPKTKDFDISSNSYSFERMKQEADKCMLLCANCHRELHAKLKNA